jgi:hypothetical protein
MRLNKFSDYLNEAKGSSMPFEIEFEECAFIVNGKPYIVDLIKMSGEARFSPPDPSVGIFGDSLDDYDIKVDSAVAVKFDTDEIAENFVNLINNARFLAMDRKTVSRLAFDYINENETDLIAVDDPAESAELVKGLDRMSSVGDLDKEILSTGDFDERIQDAILDASSHWDDDQDDYEDPEDWD